MGGNDMRVYIEPDPPPRDTPYHRKITRTEPIPYTVSGKICWLDCGPVIQTFGDSRRLDGRVLCTECRDKAEPGRGPHAGA